MPVTFSDAPDVEEIARELIPQYHEHLLRHACRIEYVFRSDTPKRYDHEIWGTARRISSLNAYLAGDEADDGEIDGSPFFCITISHPIWIRLRPEQRRALVDHELSHLWAEEDEETGETKLSILGHDLEEFRAVVQRWGLWSGDTQQMADVMRDAQATLPL